MAKRGHKHLRQKLLAGSEEEAQRPGVAVSEDGNREGVSPTLLQAKAALDQRDGGLAGKLIHDELLKNPDDPRAQHLMAQALLEVGKAGLARLCALEATRGEPNHWQTWFMLGATEAALQRSDECLYYCQKALDMSDQENGVVLRVMASAAVAKYDLDAAEDYATRALKTEDHPQCHVALAFAAFHRGNWEKGWKEFHHGLGHQQWRDKHDYGLPEWEGQEGSVLVYGEQGMGDQIAYCSTFGKNVKQINLNPKLQNLIARSFPDAEVYGQMFSKEVDFVPKADYQINMAGYQQYVGFNRKPMLKPHHDKAVMCRGLLASLGFKPKIGIAWTGGIPGTAGFRDRNLSLEDLLPILKLPVTWVSMEYRDQTEEIEAFEKAHGIKIHNFPFLTKTDDHDDAAALMSALDAVVCVPTTIYHTAGGLGKPAYVLVHSTPYYYESQDDTSPWWDSVQLFRGEERIEQVKNALHLRFVTSPGELRLSSMAGGVRDGCARPVQHLGNAGAGAGISAR